jgi:hypothetical protein
MLNLLGILFNGETEHVEWRAKRREREGKVLNVLN